MASTVLHIQVPILVSEYSQSKMGKDQNGALLEKQVKISYSDDEENIRKSKKVRKKSFSDSQEDRMRSQSRGEARESSDSDEEEDIKHRKSKRRKRKSRKRYSSEEYDSGFESEYSSSASESESQSSSSAGSERRRRKRRRRREKEEERERKRRKREKEKKRRKGREEDRKKKDKTTKKKERGKTGAVTNSWGKYGIIKETDMWNKRPEFTAWLAEVKQVNLEHLSNWEEKQMFKEFMEDHNTATFPSKKYYNLDQYHRNKIEKAIKKGMKKVSETERTVFNDEEQRRQELIQLREKKKEEEVESLKREMQSGLAQAMKEQAQLREEMAYQYKIGNFEAAAAIQRRLDPDVPM